MLPLPKKAYVHKFTNLDENKFLDRHRIPKIEEIDKSNSLMSVKDPLHL